ncbi:MAG: hypothetical protein R2844_05490 [Caldilineales bacterium]
MPEQDDKVVWQALLGRLSIAGLLVALFLKNNSRSYMTSISWRRWRTHRLFAWLWVAAGLLLLAVSMALLSSLSRNILLENWQSWQGRAIAAFPMIMVLLSGGLIAARLPAATVTGGC